MGDEMEARGTFSWSGPGKETSKYANMYVLRTEAWPNWAPAGRPEWALSEREDGRGRGRFGGEGGRDLAGGGRFGTFSHRVARGGYYGAQDQKKHRKRCINLRSCLGEAQVVGAGTISLAALRA